MNQPTKNEVILLLSVWRLEDEAYGVKIREQIKQTTKMDWNYGTLYCTLDQLVRKGHLYKTEGQPVAERGGRRKIFYQLLMGSKSYKSRWSFKGCSGRE